MFGRLMSGLDYPMWVVTARAGTERAGCLVGFATQTSIHPPRFLICISRKNHTYPVALKASVLGVHLLPTEPSGREVAELFGGETGDDLDKFEQRPWHEGPEGVPFLDELPDRFAGRVLEHVDLGDHVGFLLDPIDVERGDAGDELGFQDLKDIHPGHPP